MQRTQSLSSSKETDRIKDEVLSLTSDFKCFLCGHLSCTMAECRPPLHRSSRQAADLLHGKLSCFIRALRCLCHGTMSSWSREDFMPSFPLCCSLSGLPRARVSGLLLEDETPLAHHLFVVYFQWFPSTQFMMIITVLPSR